MSTNAVMDDGRQVIVDSSREKTRQVNGETFYLTPGYVNVFLDGGWQTVRAERLKDLGYGSPFEGLN